MKRLYFMKSLMRVKILNCIADICAEVMNKPAKKFSLGMKQRFALARAFLTRPDLLILDEPINGLDPQGIIGIRELLLRINREHHTSIFISSHILDEVSKIADTIGVIDKGAIYDCGNINVFISTLFRSGSNTSMAGLPPMQLNTVTMAALLVNATLIVWKSVLISTFIIEEYRNKTIDLLFTYPVNGAKLILQK